MAKSDKHTNQQHERQMDMATLYQLGPEGVVGKFFWRLTDFICQCHMPELHGSTCPIVQSFVRYVTKILHMQDTISINMPE